MLGLQSRNGGWGSFDADNTHDYLNNIPFADHGALLDPPTADLTARCISARSDRLLSRAPGNRPASSFSDGEQEVDGSWFGRWGTNYVYGTWSVLSALNAVGEDMAQPYVRTAVQWLQARQQGDGGWGESCGSYWAERRHEVVASTPSQTAWALLGLMAAGEVESAAVARGIDYLRRAPRQGAKWDEEAVQRRRFSARLLPPLSRLQRVLSALDSGPLPEPHGQERPPRRLGHVSPEEAERHGCGDRRLRAEARLRGL